MKTPVYQRDYTYSKICAYCGVRTGLGTQHGQFWKPGDTFTFTCVDCGRETTSPIFRHKKEATR